MAKHIWVLEYRLADGPWKPWYGAEVCETRKWARRMLAERRFNSLHAYPDQWRVRKYGPLEDLEDE